MKEYYFQSIFEEWNKVSELLEQDLYDKLNRKDARKIMMALEECISNIIMYNAEIVEVKVSWFIENQRPSITITVEDNGIEFNPMLVGDASTDANVIKKRVGGMGITIVRKLMDEVDYLYKDKNIFVMKKYLEAV